MVKEYKPLPKGVQNDPIHRWGTRLSIEMTYGTIGLERLDDRKCPSCGEDIPHHIGVGIEAKEYSLSGLCPKCQRGLFKSLENEAGEPDWVPPENGESNLEGRGQHVKETTQEGKDDKGNTDSEQGVSGFSHRNPKGQRY